MLEPDYGRKADESKRKVRACSNRTTATRICGNKIACPFHLQLHCKELGRDWKKMDAWHDRRMPYPGHWLFCAHTRREIQAFAPFCALRSSVGCANCADTIIIRSGIFCSVSSTKYY
eukprot:scaffold376_cov156-Amphora_coffeaeformis.AAC.15